MVFSEPNAFSAAEAELHIHTAAMTVANYKAKTYEIGKVKGANVRVRRSNEAVRVLGSSTPQDVKGGDIEVTFDFEKLWVNTTEIERLMNGNDLSGGFTTSYSKDPDKYFIALVLTEQGTAATGDDILYIELQNAWLNEWSVGARQGETQILQSVSGEALDVKTNVDEYA